MGSTSFSPEAVGGVTPDVTAGPRASGSFWGGGRGWGRGLDLHLNALSGNDHYTNHNEWSGDGPGGWDWGWGWDQGGDGDGRGGAQAKGKRKKKKKKKKNRRNVLDAKRAKKRGKRLRALGRTRDMRRQGYTRCQIRDTFRREAKERKRLIFKGDERKSIRKASCPQGASRETYQEKGNP